jgi:hypothetical protein
MAVGYSNPERLQRLRDELTTWTLYQVTVDLYHVMFWFENGHALLNVAHRLETISVDGSLTFVYDVQAKGDRKLLYVDHLLRRQVTSVQALDDRRLALTFEEGGRLVIHDDARRASAWFYRYDPTDHNAPLLWFVEDELGEADL